MSKVQTSGARSRVPRGTGARSRVPRGIVTIAWLTFVWIALWEDPSVANLLAGLAVALVLVTVFPIERRGAGGVPRPAAIARFAAYFAWKLMEANVVVLWEVVTPRNRINLGIVAVPIRGVSDTLTALVANAISLTPGTLTIEVRQNPTVLYVHVLHLHDIEAVRREVQHLEVLAIRAFGSAAAVAAAEADLRALETGTTAPWQATPPGRKGGPT